MTRKIATPDPAGAIVPFVAVPSRPQVANKTRPDAAGDGGSNGGTSPEAAPGAAPSPARAGAAEQASELDEERAREREEERELCQRAQEGDRRALATLLRRYGPLLYRTVLLPRLGSEAAAQDALADTYLRVLERFNQSEWRGCGVYPWLRVIAMRIALDALRAKKRETLFTPEDVSRAVDEAERDLERGVDTAICEKRDRVAARERLDEALGAINQRYATAIRLRVLEERSREESAEALGVTVPTFDVVLHRAMHALRKALHVPVEAP
jgi:RNA polymerase sigma-70 factor (ECF subfamily)